MSGWAAASIPYLKALHLLALILWCGGLLALPLMLSRHDPANSDSAFRRIRRATHLTYTTAVTPAAIVAVVAGTWLMLLGEVLVPWLYAKLLFVALLIGAHAWVGHIIVAVVESEPRRRPPPAALPLALVLLPALAILVLVLAKPELGGIAFPRWLTEPRGGQLPFAVPSR